VSVPVDVREHPRVIDRDECHLYKVGEGVVVTELHQILLVIDHSIVSYSTRIGDENMPVHWFSTSGGSEDIGFLVLNGKMDEGEGSKTFFGEEVASVEREEVK
jgi:hypothetical protein